MHSEAPATSRGLTPHPAQRTPAEEDASGRAADPRDCDVDHYARVLRDTYAARLARALTPTDFAAVFADPDQRSLFAPPTSSMRPVRDTRPGIHVSSVPSAGVMEADSIGEDDSDLTASA